MRELNIPVTTHGRILVDGGHAGPFDSARGGAAGVAQARPLKLLVGCHGYAQNADEMMDMLRSIPAGEEWTRVSVQALQRFYRGRSEVTVASWMTRQDRDLIIADNVAYVDRAIAAVAGKGADAAIDRLVFVGFSQGVAMSFRAALLGARRADAVLALGGDVPPELLVDAAMTFPKVLLARGTRDEWYTSARLDADEAALKARGATVETLTFDGAHEWHRDFATRAAAILAPAATTGAEPLASEWRCRASSMECDFRAPSPVRQVGEALVVFVDRLRSSSERSSTSISLLLAPSTAATSSFSLSWTAIESLF